MTSDKRRVVITGVGLICPLGSSPQELWQALSTAQSGVELWQDAVLGNLPLTVAAPARQFQGRAEEFGPLEKDQAKAIRKGLKVMCRECQMGVAAAQLAIADAGLGAGRSDPARTGVTFGADHMISLPEEFSAGIHKCLDEQQRFDFARWPTVGMPQMSPLWLLKYLPNMPASHLAIYNDLRGPNNSLTMREAAANLAIGDGYQNILRGSADTMVIGAAGTRIHPWKILHALQQEEVAVANGAPAEASRPFDLDRTGMVLGEGAAAVVLEELGTAQARNARIYGEVVGWASSAVVGRRLVAHRDQALTNVLQHTLAAAGAVPEEVGHVHAHGLSTRSCDVEESRAIHTVFGSRSRPVPVVAAKSYFGNLGAGSGMVELIASLLAQEAGHLFSTLNYRTPDPQCPLNIVNDMSTTAGDSFVNLSVTPQGQASAAMVRRYVA
jgi:3-oxoacyl-[acyl-carrier-protein] synthase II